MVGTYFATFVRNVFPIYSQINGMLAEASRLSTLSGVFSIVFPTDLFPRR